MGTHQIAFAIRDLSCAHCAEELERDLSLLDGVIAAEVNYASERVTLVYERNKWNAAKVAQVIQAAGCATLVEQRISWREWRALLRLPADAVTRLALNLGKRTVTMETLAEASVQPENALGWRGLMALVLERGQGQSQETHEQRAPRPPQTWLPVAVGMVGAAALLGLYLGVLSVLQSPQHALDQLVTDIVWVGLVALGFGIQVGLYAYLRLIIRAMKLAGATAMAGAGTGTSTLGMVACCAHHLTDIAPLIGLTGASGLSGVVSWLGEWKLAFILIGLAVNAVGIGLSLRTIRKQQAHLEQMERAAARAGQTAAAACH